MACEGTRPKPGQPYKGGPAAPVTRPPSGMTQRFERRRMYLLLDPQTDGIPGAAQNACLLHTFQRDQRYFSHGLIGQHHLQ